MAKITVIGGTGYAGSAIVKEAKSRGHEVTSISRSAPAAPLDGVTYRTSPATEAASTIAGSDVVVAALSPRGDNAGTLLGVYRQLAEASAKANARFVAVGGFSSLRPAAGAPRFAEGNDIPPAYIAEAKEMNSILSDLEAGATTADWLFVSPAGEFGSYVPGEALGHYRVGSDVALFDGAGKSAISGADFARAIVDEIEKPTRHKAQIHFAY
jgi:putative NADH-flavin reductase